MLWKAADQQGSRNVDFTKFGWEVTEGIPSPCIVTGLHTPQGLIGVINCSCKAEGKADAALRGVIAATITTCRALSTVHVQQSMGVATYLL